MECFKEDEIGEGGKVHVKVKNEEEMDMVGRQDISDGQMHEVYIKMEEEDYFESNDAPEKSIHQVFIKVEHEDSFEEDPLNVQVEKSARLLEHSADSTGSFYWPAGDNRSVGERNGLVNSKSGSIGRKRTCNDTRKVSIGADEVTDERESCIVEIKSELVQEPMTNTTSRQYELADCSPSSLEADNNFKNTTFECPFCRKEFAFKSHMLQHMKIHTGEKPFKCELCGYRTTERSNLKTHARKHTGEKPFKCNLCEYRTSYNACLKSHLRIHSGEKPFKCQYCQYRTADSSNMRTHLRTH